MHGGAAGGGGCRVAASVMGRYESGVDAALRSEWLTKGLIPISIRPVS